MVNIFQRISYIVDNYYDENASAFCRDIEIKRQTYSKWKNEYEKEDKEPNISFYVLQRILETVIDNTDVSPVWLLTGNGEIYVSDRDQEAVDLASDHKKAINGVGNSELSPDVIAQYLVKNRKAVLEFLRSLE